MHSHKKLKAAQQTNDEFGRLCLLELNAVESNQAYWQRIIFQSQNKSEKNIFFSRHFAGGRKKIKKHTELV